MKRVTIKDVAALAGVAPSTVSFVLNNTASQTISEITSRKVLEAAQTLGYRANYMASTMRSNQTKTIGIVIISHSFYHLFFSSMLAGIFSVADAQGYGVLICETNQDNCQTGSYIQYFKEGRIDGILFISSAHSENKSKELEYIQEFKDNKIPFVTVYGYTNLPGHNYVNIDFFQCGKDACNCLLRRGAKKILFVAPMLKTETHEEKYQPKTEMDKLLGCKAAVDESSDPACSFNVLYLPLNFKEYGFHKIAVKLKKEIEQHGYDGFAASWSTYGIQLLNILTYLSIPIPEQMKVIAMDTLPYLEHYVPSLSTMQLPFFEIAQKGTDILIQSFSGKKQQDQDSAIYHLPCKLLELESTMMQKYK